MMNIRSYKKAVREMQSGETFYLNSINASVAMIEYTKQLIAEGIIAPLRSEVERYVVADAVEKYMSGEYIFPQMEYIKL